MPDPNFFTTAWDTIAQYGEFPIGIVIGMFLTKSAYSDTIKYLNEEKKELREEKKELRKTISSQQTRIDTLHDKVFPANSEEGSQ
jgi:prefoldin subunit 5